MVLALLVSGAVVVLVLLGLFVFGLRRRLIQRSGGTFDCSLRWDVPETRDASPAARAGSMAWRATTATGSSGSGCSPTRPGPAASWSAPPSRSCERRTPQGEEELALLSDSTRARLRHRGTRLELAMSEDALTGFLAWLEAAPPGQRVNVA